MDVFCRAAVHHPRSSHEYLFHSLLPVQYPNEGEVFDPCWYVYNRLPAQTGPLSIRVGEIREVCPGTPESRDVVLEEVTFWFGNNGTDDCILERHLKTAEHHFETKASKTPEYKYYLATGNYARPDRDGIAVSDGKRL